MVLVVDYVLRKKSTKTIYPNTGINIVRGDGEEEPDPSFWRDEFKIAFVHYTIFFP